jgi:argininosuccinate lyase
VAAANAIASTPFTNSIEVGTEAVSAIWPGLRAADEAVLLSQVLVSGGRPVPDRMLERTASGYTSATAVANRLVQQGVPFRAAHHMVGDAVRQAVAAGATDITEFGPPGWLDGTGLASTDPAMLVREQMYGGGPGDIEEPLNQAVQAWAAHRARLHDYLAKDRAGAESLAAAVGAYL